MSQHPAPVIGAPPAKPEANRREQRKVAAASMVGTTIEWYDFFIYANCAALVFQGLFFGPVGKELGVLLSFATIGLSFIFRPLGAIIAGHLGDKFGRKAVLVTTLLMMGISTFLIGLLPTYEQIGITAPILLIVLRILQGISAGGEWGGAALMSVEFAPKNKRGLFGSAPQIATPIALILASGVIGLMSVIAPGDAFLAWGWRVPFMLSAVMVVVGLVVRRTIEESPVFTAMREASEGERVPLAALLRKFPLLVLVVALTFMANNGLGYMTAGGFIQKFASDPEGPVALDRSTVLFGIAITAVFWLIGTLAGGWLSDRIGRRTTYFIGWAVLAVMVFPMFHMVSSGSIVQLVVGVSIFSVGLGLSYGPQSAFFAELFPSSVRYSGVSIAYALGAILGGAFAPTIATALLQKYGSLNSVGVYLMIMVVISAAATFLLRDRRGIELGHENEAEQSRGMFIFSK